MNHCVFPISDESARHPIHTRERNWAETNCYVDVWIELLHAWGFDPVAALPFTVGIDFEGDQWTFFKFPLMDLRELYGLEVQELLIWRPLSDHLVEQVRLGRPVLVELDSFYLPDTVGTSYRREHVKSTVAVIEMDVERRRMGYFHGQGYYHLEGEDFEKVLRRGEGWLPELLPPYVEFVKTQGMPCSTMQSLVTASLRLLQREVDRLPEENPFLKFQRAFTRDLVWLTTSPLEVFHRYSFATWRQFGACYELSSLYLQWLKQHRVCGFEEAQRAFEELSGGAKTLQFQLARAMARKKPLDPSLLDPLAATWSRAVAELRSGLAWNESSVEHDPEFVESR